MTDGTDDAADLGAYQLLADTLPHLVWLARSDGTVTYFNHRRELYGGLEPGPEGVYEWAPIVHPEDLGHTQEAWQAAVGAGAEYECEHRVCMADGSYRWHLSRAIPLGAGTSKVWFGTATDTQVLVDASDVIAASESRLRSVFSAIDQGYCLCEVVVDDEGRPIDYRFLETNPLFEEATGLRDALGKTAKELVPSLEQHWIDTYAAVALGEAPIRFQQESPAMGRHFDVFAMPVAPRGRFALVFADITSQRAALAALRESEQRFRNMADHSPVMIWITDDAGECSYLNRRWYEFTGQTEQGALGRGWLGATHPDDRDEAAMSFADATVRHQAFRLDYRLRRHDGTYRWVVDAAAPRFAGDGRFLGFVGSVLDITERKVAERDVSDQRDREHEIAVGLQQSMLPTALVDDSRLDIAATYLPGAHMLQVGGDWYETFSANDGRIGIVVGDVVGHNTAAAAAMGQLRAGLLALTPYVDSPEQLLCELDRFAQRHQITDFATALCIFLELDDGAIEYSSAGHPPALLCSEEGEIRWLDGAVSAPLGTTRVDHRPTAVDVLEPRSVLVAYSDGLIERRGELIDAGLLRLAGVVRRMAARPMHELCDLTVKELAGPGGYEDDTVIVGLQRVERPTLASRIEDE